MYGIAGCISETDDAETYGEGGSCFIAEICTGGTTKHPEVPWYGRLSWFTNASRGFQRGTMTTKELPYLSPAAREVHQSCDDVTAW